MSDSARVTTVRSHDGIDPTEIAAVEAVLAQQPPTSAVASVVRDVLAGLSWALKQGGESRITVTVWRETPDS